MQNLIERPEDVAKTFKSSTKSSEVTKGTLCGYHTNKV